MTVGRSDDNTERTSAIPGQEAARECAHQGSIGRPTSGGPCSAGVCSSSLVVREEHAAFDGSAAVGRVKEQLRPNSTVVAPSMLPARDPPTATGTKAWRNIAKTLSQGGAGHGSVLAKRRA